MTPTILVAIALLVGVSAFFSGSEIAVFSLEDHRLDGLAAEPGGAALTRLREDPHRLLVTVLVGNNVVNVAIASLTTALFVGRVGGGASVVLATVFATRSSSSSARSSRSPTASPTPNGSPSGWPVPSGPSRSSSTPSWRSSRSPPGPSTTSPAAPATSSGRT